MIPALLDERGHVISQFQYTPSRYYFQTSKGLKPFLWDNVMRYATFEQKVTFSKIRKKYLNHMSKMCSLVNYKPHVVISSKTYTPVARTRPHVKIPSFPPAPHHTIKKCKATIVGTIPHHPSSNADIVLLNDVLHNIMYIKAIRKHHFEMFQDSPDDVFDVHFYSTTPNIFIERSIALQPQRQWSMYRMAYFLSSRGLTTGSEKHDAFCRRLINTSKTNPELSFLSSPGPEQQAKIFKAYERSVKHFAKHPTPENYCRTKYYENDAYFSIFAFLDVVNQHPLNKDEMMDSIYDNFGFVLELLIHAYESKELKYIIYNIIRTSKYLLRILMSIRACFPDEYKHVKTIKPVLEKIKALKKIPITCERRSELHVFIHRFLLNHPHSSSLIETPHCPHMEFDHRFEFLLGKNVLQIMIKNIFSKLILPLKVF